MVKKTKQRKTRPEIPSALEEAGDVDWKPLYRALQESIDWALDIAATLAAPYPEEVEAIERVRVFVRAKLLGRPAQVRIADVMLTFGIIIAAIERDLSPDGRAVLAPFRFAVGVSAASLPNVFRIPAASELWEPTVTQHCPGAHAVPTRRAPHIRYVA